MADSRKCSPALGRIAQSGRPLEDAKLIVGRRGKLLRARDLPASAAGSARENQRPKVYRQLLSKRSAGMDVMARTTRQHSLLFCKRSEGKIAMRVAPTSTWLSRTVLGRNLDHVFPINAFKSDNRYEMQNLCDKAQAHRRC
jgi:hypothetical protein